MPKGLPLARLAVMAALADAASAFAALQHASHSGRPVLLLYDSHSGHSGEMPAAAEIDQTAHELAFLLWRTGARPGGGGR